MHAYLQVAYEDWSAASNFDESIGGNIGANPPSSAVTAIAEEPATDDVCLPLTTLSTPLPRFERGFSN